MGAEGKPQRAEERVGGQEVVSISTDDSVARTVSKGREEMRLWFEGIIKSREAFGGVR